MGWSGKAGRSNSLNKHLDLPVRAKLVSTQPSCGCPCVRRGSRLSAAQNPPPVFPRKTSAGDFGLAQGIAFTEEHALFRFRPFLHRSDDFGGGAHGPKLGHALAVSGKGMKKFGIRDVEQTTELLARFVESATDEDDFAHKL